MTAWMVRFACVCLLVMTVMAASPCLAGGQGEGAPVTDPETATNLAVAYTGLPETRVTEAVQRTVTDPTVPVFDVTDRSVWEVVFSEVSISVPGPDGAVEDNANIHEVHVWLDSQTGALVKAFTPPPTEGGLARKLGAREKGLLTGNRISLSPSPATPRVSFLSALSVANAKLPGSAVQAREIVAYYGLMTDTMPVDEAVVDRPAWFVYLGGIAQSFTSGGPPGGPGVGPATEALVILDADTGAWHTTFLSGRPAQR